MKYVTVTLGLFVGLLLGLITACSGLVGKTQHSAEPSPTLSTTPTTTPQRTDTPNDQYPPNSKLRRVDFGNFTFPKLPTGKCLMQEVHLVNGRYNAPEEIAGKLPSIDCWSVTLGTVIYGDVTGDGNEEAIVVLYAERGGTESASDVYVYAWQAEQPVLLWKFATGDRADGGLRRLYAENGELVVELYGVGTAVGKNLFGTEEVGACCPKHYTRTKYRWVEDRFLQDGSEQVLVNPSGSTAAPATN
jgi:hypothetical protein